MAPSDRPSTVTLAIKSLMDAQKANLGASVIFYGDQLKIPSTPAICVEAAPFTRVIDGIGGKGRTHNTFVVHLLIYLVQIRDIQQIDVDIQIFAEAVMDKLHTDVTIGGVVTHGYVTSIEPGYSTRAGKLYRSARVTWEAITKTQIA